MASAQVVEMSVTNNSPSQDSNHPDDIFQSRYFNPGFKPFSYLQELVAILDASFILFGVFDISLRSWSCDSTKMCIIFRQIPFPYWVKERQSCDLIITCSSRCFWPSTFWEARDQPQPGSWETLGVRSRAKPECLVTTPQWYCLLPRFAFVTLQLVSW